MKKGNYGADDLRALRGNPEAAGNLASAIRKGIKAAEAEKTPKAKPTLNPPSGGSFSELAKRLKGKK